MYGTSQWCSASLFDQPHRFKPPAWVNAATRVHRSGFVQDACNNRHHPLSQNLPLWSHDMGTFMSTSVRTRKPRLGAVAALSTERNGPHHKEGPLRSNAGNRSMTHPTCVIPSYQVSSAAVKTIEHIRTVPTAQYTAIISCMHIYQPPRMPRDSARVEGSFLGERLQTHMHAT